MPENLEKLLKVTPYVFVYGTLKEGYANSGFLDEAIDFVGNGITYQNNYNLFDCGFPYLDIEGDNHVAGEVYEIDEQILANLDMLEGHPHHYTRSLIVVEIDEDEEDVRVCWVYFASPHTRNKLHLLPKCPSFNGVAVWG